MRKTELIVLQGTSFCNLNCSYCDLSVESRKRRDVMAPDLLERIFHELFSGDRLADEAKVIWHSGEPLTLPPAYYDDAIARIEALKSRFARPGLALRYDIQTNGVLIDDAWCDLFTRHRHHLGIGISCDGPAFLHDAYRRNWGGAASHAKTVRGMDRLAAAGLRYKVIAVVTEKTLQNPGAFLDFFHRRRDQLSGFHFNILASAEGQSEELSYSRQDRARYQEFYRQLLDALAAKADAAFDVQNFSNGFGRILHGGRPDRAPVIAETSAPFKALNFDADGHVTTFHAGLDVATLADEYGDGKGLALGNIRDMSLDEMAATPKFARMAGDFERSVAHCLANCDYAGVCSGGFEITKRLTHGDFAAPETPECVVHVMALTDALLDDLDRHVAAQGPEAAPDRPAVRAAGQGALA